MFYFYASFHSFVDVITNSSTVIYVNNDGVPSAIKTLIEEMGKSLGFSEKCDDMFNISVLLRDEDRYIDYLEDLDTNDLEKIDPNITAGTNMTEYVNTLMNDIIQGKVDKPDWMDDVEIDCRSNDLHIIAKDDRYTKIGVALKKLVNAQDMDAEYDS